MKKILFLAATILLCADRLTAVPVHINSGNPAYPFPQFLEYTYGDSHRLGNLGTKNAEGVVHAELEQDIRDAYQIHANEFEYTGEVWGGYKYIWTPYKSAYDCTEGDGYGLLAAAYMADMVTFNGYWMCTHDKRRNRSKSYSGCAGIASDYSYGPYAIGDDGPGGNTAADGDVDVALALYVAYKQWGEFMRDLDGNIVNDACGNPISYKEAMIEVLRGLVAMSTCRYDGDCGNGGKTLRVNSGLIGLDGYPKGGDTWNEQTSWANANPFTFSESYEIFNLPGNGKVDVKGLNLIPEFGSGTQHIDYNAPAYFREFYELFEELGGDPWEIEQFRRGEASSDWLIGKLIEKNQYSIPTAGWCEVNNDGTQTSFTNFNQGEDYRCSWRTIANYVWHGNPIYTWNPTTHKVDEGGNTYEYDAAVKFSRFLNDPAHWNPSGGSECVTYGDPAIPYSGPATLNIQYDPMTGISQSTFYVLNWQNGTGTFAAVSAQDYDLMGLLYRQCAIEWDNTKIGDGYLTSTPNYMHGWARHLGMMVTSGNYHAPSQMNPGANMKIYRAIEDSVTYCYTGDQIKFLLDYRNYGSVDAKNVVIVENVPSDFIFIEASDGGVYDKTSHTVTWNIGTVSGVKSDNKSGAGLDLTSGNLAKTVGQVWYKLRASDKAKGRYCTTADISCSNGLGWTTNEYPNYKTATMQRNCVDVVPRSLTISKEADRTMVNDGNMVTYTVKFENSSDAGWIDGGRPRVNVSFANGLDGSRLQIMARLWNDAIEPYINYGNYRISYFLYDAGFDCYSGDADCPTGWSVSNEIYEGGKTIGSSEGVVISHENIIEKSDAFGRANQRLTIQFAPLLVTTTMHVSRYFGGAGGRIHKGGSSPMRGVWAFFPSNYGAVNWEDDWSYSSSYNSKKDGLFYPITPSWQKLDEKGNAIEEPVTKWLTCGCTESKLTVPNILVEEYDGYVWRRILGNGPISGRDVENVVVRDTLPKGLKFDSFVNECPLSEPEFGGKWEVTQTSDGRDVIVWSIPKLQAGRKGSIIYTAVASFPSRNVCETPDEDIINYAWIAGDKNSAISDTAKVTVTCAKVPKPIVPTTMTKISDKEIYEVGDPIEYTIGYKQTHGSIFDDALSNPSDWTLSDASISNGVLSISQGNKATFNKSLSKNIYVEMDANIAEDQEGEIIFRDNIRLQFKYNKSNGLSVTCYDGTKQVEQQICGLKNNPSRWRIKLQDDILQVWFGKDTSAGAGFTASALTEKEGKLSFNGAAWGNFKYSNMHIHTDYAYDLSITDFVPAEVVVDEGSFESYHNGKSTGTGKFYKASHGSDDQDRIEWTRLADNPIAFGDTFTVIWKGTVAECAESIINVAQTQLLGHEEGEIAAQAVSGCGTLPCQLTSAEISIDDGQICAMSSTTLRASAVPDGEYLYQFYENGEKIGKLSKSDTLDVSPVRGDYSYSVSVYDASDTTCSIDSETPAILKVTSKPASLPYDLGRFCAGKANLLALNLVVNVAQADGNVFHWIMDSDETTTMPAVNEIVVPGDYDIPYFVESAHGCLSDSAHLTFTIADTFAIILQDSSICPNTVGILDAGGEAGFRYEWSTGENTKSINVDKSGTYTVTVTNSDGCVSHASSAVALLDTLEIKLVDLTICMGRTGVLDAGSDGVSYLWSDGTTEQKLTVGEAGEYGVTVTNADGCASHAQAEVTVAEQLVVDLGGDATVCKSDLPYVLDAGAGYDSYEWSDGSTGQTLKASADGVYSVKVTQGGCDGGGEAKVTVSTVDAPKVAGPVSYLVSDTAANGVFDKSLTKQSPTAIEMSEELTYKWYADDKTPLDGEPTPDVPIGGGNATHTYYITATNADGCESEPSEVTVTVSGAPTPVVENVAYCLNDPTLMPLTATASAGGDVSETWTLRWYDASGNAIEAPTPDVSSVGETTYYVSQISGTTGAESGRVPLKVTVYGVAKPDVSGNRLQYCAGEPHEAVSAASNADASNFLMGDGKYLWTMDGADVTIPTANNQKETVKYTVRETYAISADHVCEGDAAEFEVKTTFVPSVGGDLAVNYLMKDGESGAFPALDAKNPNVAAASDGFTLIWFDEDKNAIGANAPIPAKDPSWTAGEEQTLTYHVAQTDGTCTGDTVGVTVKISDSPMPKTSPVEYCRNAEASALTATVNDDMEPADNYTLVWYDAAGAETTAAPTPSTQSDGEFAFEVAQRHKATGATSGKSTVKVTVHALPELKADAIPAQCGGTVVLGGFVKETTGTATKTVFYADADAATETDGIATKSGTYYAQAYFTLPDGSECRSNVAELKVTINDLSDLTIEGDATSCPDGTKTLTATATSTDPGVTTYRWEDGTESESGVFTTPALTGGYGTAHTFTVTASAGACVETQTATHTITVDRGVRTGNMLINDEVRKQHKICAGETVKIATTHYGDNYRWTANGERMNTPTDFKVLLNETTTFVLTFTNVCEASDTVTVEVYPLEAAADWTNLDKTICEGEPFSASVTATGYDAGMEGAYIKWYKDGSELLDYDGRTSISVEKSRASDAGTYSYKVSNGICEKPEAEDAAELKVIVPATFAAEDAVSCSGDAVDISVAVNEDDAELSWDDDASTSTTRSVSPSENTDYPFTIKRGGVCTTKGSVTVSVKEKPGITAEDFTICEGETATVDAKVDGDELTSYTWSDGEGNTIGTASRLTLKPTATDNYTLTVESRSCGDATATVTGTVVPLPELEIDSIAIQTRDVIVTNATVMGYEYRMDDGGWQADNRFEKLAYSVLHTAYAKDADGCEGSLMFQVTAPPVDIPMFFTPQGDGVNDSWDLTTLLQVYPNAEVKIYDRYGKEVARLKGDTSDWDGTYNGHALPSTDYWYTVNIPEIDQVYTGHFTLIRSN